MRHMSISLKEIEHLADLARLDLTAEEKKKYQKELSGVLDYVEKIQSLKDGELSKAESAEAAFRQDKILDCPADDVRQIINSFPTKEGNATKVKAVFE